MRPLKQVHYEFNTTTRFFCRLQYQFYSDGDIYISFIGLLVIALSFAISWQYITSGKSRIKASLSKTALMIRYMLYEKFDKKSICGFLLALASCTAVLFIFALTIFIKTSNGGAIQWRITLAHYLLFRL